MVETSKTNNLFNDIPFFKGDKGFSVIYLDGEFHLFFACSKAFKSVIMHYSSSDCFTWTRCEDALAYKGFIESVTAFTQTGKIFIYYATKNLFCLSDVRLAVSKDGEIFESFPNALVKNTALRDIKTFYSEGSRYVIGSEKEGLIPAYLSTDNIILQKTTLKNVAYEGEISDYIGSPSPFVAYGKTYVAYSMFGAHVVEAKVDLASGEISLGKKVLETYGECMRSLMIREATPLIFVGCGSSLIPVEVYATKLDLGFRLYRDALKGAKLRVDNGVEENEKMPTNLVREEGMLHLFELPIVEGLSLDFGGTDISIDEYKSIVIDGAIENYGIVEQGLEEIDVLEVAVFDMGNLLVVEILDKLYTIPTNMSDVIKVNVGEKDYQYTSYKL